MDVAVTTIVLIGVVLSIGAGTFARHVAGDVLPRGAWRRLQIGLVAGGAMVIAGSLGEVVTTVDRMLRGPFDVAFVGEYLLSTRHGHSVLAGIVITLALIAWGPRRRGSRAADRLVHAALSLSLLATLAWVSHSGALGVLPFLGDLGHLAAATAWAGALAYLAWTPVWRLRRLPLMIRRMSAIGLVSVVLLLGTGTYMAVLHVYGLEALTGTAYGVSLLVKLALVGVIIGLAGVNRWWLVPLVERRRPGPLLVAVRIESLLLALVLVATAVLTTREPAHDHPQHAPADHARGVLEPTGDAAPANRLAVGPHDLVVGGDGRGALSLRLEGDTGAVLDLEALTPGGDLVVLIAEGADSGALRLEPGDGALVPLPTTETGVWRLLGLLDEEAFALDVTVARATTADGLDVELVLVPAPSLAGGGRTVAFVGVPEAAAAQGVTLRYRMPGMEHASDTARIGLLPPDAGHAHGHAPGADAAPGVAELTLPMVGTWRFTVEVGDEAVVLEVEMRER